MEYFAELSMWIFGSHGEFADHQRQLPAPGPAGLARYDAAGFDLVGSIYDGTHEALCCEEEVAAPRRLLPVSATSRSAEPQKSEEAVAEEAGEVAAEVAAEVDDEEDREEESEVASEKAAATSRARAVGQEAEEAAAEEAEEAEEEEAETTLSEAKAEAPSAEACEAATAGEAVRDTASSSTTAEAQEKGEATSEAVDGTSSASANADTRACTVEIFAGPHALSLAWINEKGEPVPYGIVPVGGVTAQRTFPGHGTLAQAALEAPKPCQISMLMSHLCVL